MAERVGFEPTDPCGSPDFESGTFDLSVTSPKTVVLRRGLNRDPQLSSSMTSRRAVADALAAVIVIQSAP